MAQPNRSKPNSTSDKHLASINFPKELIDFLDEQSTESGINRSALVCMIIKEFKDSGKKIRYIIE